MKTAALILALAAPLAAQTLQDRASPSGAAPEPASPDLTTPPSAVVKESARKAAEEVKADPPKAAPAAASDEAKTEAPVPAAAAGKHAVAKAAEAAKTDAPKTEEAAPKSVEIKASKPSGPDEEWAFVKAAAADPDGAMQEAAIENLSLFVRRYPDYASAPDALALLAGLRVKKGQWQQGATELLRLIYEYADSSAQMNAKSSYLELIKKKAWSSQRPAFNALVVGSDAVGKADRLSALWQKAADKEPEAFYEPAADGIRDFFVRFPAHPDNDKLQAALARLHAANGKPASAATAWRKLLALYPDSGLRAGAQLALGDLYADALRDPKKAIDAYQELIAAYPQAPEILAALENSARLFDEKLRQYELSAQMDEQIVKTFPKTPASMKALKSIARLQRDRLGKPDEAIKTLLRLSAMHGGQDGVDALLLAADIARGQKDYAHEAALRHQVADDYSAVKEAPQALYDAAYVYEDDVKDTAKAVATFKEIAAKYPSHKLAKKATDRVAKLTAAN